MIGNQILTKAKINKNDEFYTLYDDIEKAVSQIKDKLEGKIVYCNCDNPKFSNFFKYFKNNFKALKLKKVYCSFLDENGETQLTIIEGENQINQKPMVSGNCFEEESIQYLIESDIVITNPPFSLLNDFIKMLMDYKKDFLIIGNFNVTSNVDIFPYFRDRKINIWHYKSMYFKIPSSYDLKSKQSRIFEETHCVKIANAKWISTFENPFDISNFYQKIQNNKYQNLKHKYLECHNIDAINCNSLNDLPFDYKGVLAVPCNIFEYLGSKDDSPFEIVGQSTKNFYSPKLKYINPVYQNTKGEKVKGTKGYNFTLHNATKPKNKGYFVCDNFEGYFTLLFKRVLIKIK